MEEVPRTTRTSAHGRGGKRVPQRKSRAGLVTTSAAANSPLDSRFFKTKLCSFWQEGRCLRSTDCKYAHGEKEISATPDLTKTALCRELLRRGECDIPNCPFAHTHEELRATTGVYKTAMCAFFPTGRCRLGAFCRHAHHESELRPRENPRAEGEAESDDELGELPQTAWERTATMPPALEESRRAVPTLPPGAWDLVVQSPSKMHNSWVDLAEEDDDELSVNGDEDMWHRLQTMPEPSAAFPKQFQEMRLPLRPPALPTVPAPCSINGPKQWSREVSAETASWNGDSLRSSCSDWSSQSMPSVTNDSLPPMMVSEDASMPVGVVAPVPVVTVVPVMLVGTPLGKPYPAMLPQGAAVESYPQMLREQLEASAQALRDAAPDHYED
mmetsp:Transcript_74014/g.158643  ORF Transcript_74014/g.158643 Transcript_74014/m.158643 type:complete len:385 (+) Transcript_74014:121-1275(+)